MNYKGPVAAILLCIALASISIPASAELIASHDPAQFQHQEKSAPHSSPDSLKTTSAPKKQPKLDMLDTLWIASFAIAGLVLLRKIQGE